MIAGMSFTRFMFFRGAWNAALTAMCCVEVESATEEMEDDLREERRVEIDGRDNERGPLPKRFGLPRHSAICGRSAIALTRSVN